MIPHGTISCQGVNLNSFWGRQTYPPWGSKMATRYKGTREQRRALDLMITVMRGSDSYIARLMAPLAGLDLTPSQFGVLETLYHLGPLKPSQLAEKHLKSRNNLTVVIENLERAGLVNRVRCPQDRRSHWIHLTDSGRERVEQTLPIFVESAVREAKALSPSEQETLSELMKKLGKAG